MKLTFLGAFLFCMVCQNGCWHGTVAYVPLSVSLSSNQECLTFGTVDVSQEKALRSLMNFQKRTGRPILVCCSITPDSSWREVSLFLDQLAKIDRAHVVVVRAKHWSPGGGYLLPAKDVVFKWGPNKDFFFDGDTFKSVEYKKETGIFSGYNLLEYDESEILGERL